jgi:hypothetical protein
LSATRLANAALSRSATCSGPSVALIPNSTIVKAISAISTITGSSASRKVGGLGAPAGAAAAASPVDTAPA